MKHLCLILCLTLIGCASTAIITSSVAGQDELRSDIDPFAKPAPVDRNESRPESRKISIFPKLSFGSGKKSNGPTALQKLNYGTKRVWIKSKATLMPWTRKEKAPTHVTGLKPKPEKKSSNGFIANLLKPFPDDPEPVTTADDWFRQPRPGFSD